jgi:uncharacterized protein YbjT (DUF2867 family)
MNDGVMERGGSTMPMSGATGGRILVAGATGLAGAAVLREFIRNSHPVQALVRRRARARAFGAFPTVEVVEGDLSRPATLQEALAGVERVLLISSPDQQMAERQSRFIDAAKQADVQHIVKFSGLSAADVDTPFVFGSLQADIERYREGSGLAWTQLRPSQFMTELTTPGHEARSYAMSGPEALSMEEVAEQISAAIGRAVRYVPITREERRQALLAAGVSSVSVAALDVQAGERLKGTEATVHLETHTALGIAPTPFAEFGRHAGAFLGDRSMSAWTKAVMNRVSVSDRLALRGPGQAHRHRADLPPWRRRRSPPWPRRPSTRGDRGDAAMLPDAPARGCTRPAPRTPPSARQLAGQG